MYLGHLHSASALHILDFFGGVQVSLVEIFPNPNRNRNPNRNPNRNQLIRFFVCGILKILHKREKEKCYE